MITLEFTASAARELELAEPVLRMMLAVDPGQRGAIESALRRVFSFDREEFRPELRGGLAEVG